MYNYFFLPLDDNDYEKVLGDLLWKMQKEYVKVGAGQFFSVELS